MSFGEATNFTTHHLMDWLEESASFLDDPYSVSNYDWWAQDLDQINPIHNPSISTTPYHPTTTPVDSPPPMHAELSKKRKLSTDQTAKQHHRKRADAVGEVKVHRKPGNGRKAQDKGGNKENTSNRDARWAEQLLNPCASAIESGNISRVEHLVCVLNELASLSGDANHRLAFHGLRSLTRHHSTPPSLASTEISLFRSSLIKFHEVSPWFAFPNALANASILHAADSAPPRPLHVVDIGVSHGIQWPTLLEALTRRQGGAPELVRITSAGSAAPAAPFSSAPPGYDFDSHLLRYAKSINLNLRIDRVEELKSVAWSPSGGETLVVCVQFRSLGDEFLEAVREMAPDLVVMSEMDGGEEGGEGFAGRAGMMWRFLDSTCVAFRGRDCEERRVVEGEAAMVLDGGAAVEGRQRWRERIAAAGFREERFAEEAVEAGRALLRKYDGNWEMRALTSAATTMAALPEAAVGLRWKGQPVSLCSLWKPILAPGSS